MPEPSAWGAATAAETAGADRAGQEIYAIRRSLGLGSAEERIVHTAGDRLRPFIDGWVDQFMTRLVTDPVAMQIVDDDARAIRAKRSLTAWFHEMFSLPYDEHYERLRERIGHTHFDLNMPPYLMLTAMGGVRRDVLATVRTVYDAEPAEEVRAVARAVALALDMEQTLIVSAFRRRERTLGRQHDRAVYGRRAASHFLHILMDRIDAALCYLELARRDPATREASLVKTADVLRHLARFDQRMREHSRIETLPPRRVILAELLARAVSDVSMDGGTRVEVTVQPPDLEATLVPAAVHQAIEELIQNAAVHAPGGCIRLRGERQDPDRLILEITDEGPGWGPEVKDVQDLLHRGRGLGLSFCELVAEIHGGQIELFPCASGGAGVRLELRELPATAGDRP